MENEISDKQIREDKPVSPLNDLFDMLELMVLCAAVIILIYTFFIRMTVVNQHSMEKTLIEGDYTVVSDLFYTPATGDIVVVQNTALKSHSDPLVKRVIAVGGDTLNVNYSSWKVTLTHNGEKIVLDESEYIYLTGSSNKLTTDWPTKKEGDGNPNAAILEKDGSYTYEIPEGYLFVMGDNRNVSADSRSKEIGLIPESCVVGHVLFRLFPLSKFGTVS